jgi:hypothetical protein
MSRPGYPVWGVRPVGVTSALEIEEAALLAAALAATETGAHDDAQADRLGAIPLHTEIDMLATVLRVSLTEPTVPPPTGMA